jgi:hypothetical protein
MSFGGVTFNAARDGARLSEQLVRVFNVMADNQWRTLGELAAATNAPEASVSARLRDLRKPKFGGLTVESRFLTRGLWAYRIRPQENQ